MYLFDLMNKLLDSKEMGREKLELISILLILTVLAAIYMAWTIGANDVANAMGTSVGSGAISLRTAIIIAGLFDFLGAVLVGGHVSATIKGSIFDPAAFANAQLIAYGMFAALLGTALFITLATYLNLPVSTSHGIVGGVVGFAVTSAVMGHIQFSDIAGGKLIEIVISWLVSPLAGGVFAFLTYLIVKRTILHSNTPRKAARKVVPVFVGVVFFILTLSIIWKGLKNLGLSELPFVHVLGIALSSAVIAGLLAYILLQRTRHRKGDGKYDLVDRIFGYLLILTACYIAFAHGANDVANAIGPLAAVISIFNHGYIDPNASIPIWVLFIGGIAIIIGIATWGYKVIETIGTKITVITPSKGFAATFGAATSVLICSKMGLPVSTSHCAVGGVIGVGLSRGTGAIDFKVVRNIALSWVITIPAAATLTVIIYLVLIGIFGST